MLLDVLKKYWQYDSFRPLQEDIMRSVLDHKRDTLALLPTGGGKSVCFQVPALCQDGVCVVVTPLIALMKDQVEQLKRRKIPAAAIFSGMHYNEIDIALDNCIHGNTKFLYVSPERLHTDIFQARLKLMTVSMLVVDEAHCVSQWGYDFRPSYLRIAEIRQLLPNVPLMALTATATEAVKNDIVAQLQMQDAAVFQATFARQNLSFSSFFEEYRDARLLKILANVQGSGIVYVRNRRRTKELSDWLNRNGVRSEFYHAGLNNKVRSEKQEAWIRNRVRVIVATNAFGMGIDKPDVRVVVHLDLPDSLEAYYQEAGRGGRDGAKAYAVALYSQKDIEDLREGLDKKYPPLDLIRRVYQALANYYKIPIGGSEFESFNFDYQDFVGTFGLPASDTHHCLKLLQKEGFIGLSEQYFSPSKIHITAGQKEIYNIQLKNPALDAFIKLLLRMYGGELYTQFVSISESAIAQKHYVPEAEVVQMLQGLHQKTVIVYEKQRDKPQLTLLTPRYDASLLPLQALDLEHKKQIDQQRIEAMINYVSHQAKCRMALFQQYFGEASPENCGICDNCLSKKKRTITPDYKQIEAHILGILRQNSFSPQQIVASVGAKNEAVAITILKDLLADEVIVYSSDGRLRSLKGS